MAEKITQIAAVENALVLNEPGANEVVRVQLGDQPLQFQFSLDSATFAIEGNDLVISFANGGKIIVEDYVTDAPLGAGSIVAADGSELVPADIAIRLEGAKVVEAPGANEVSNIEVGQNEALLFNFDPASAQIEVSGDDLILVFADGGRIVLEGFFAPGGESGSTPLTLLSDGSLLSGDLITALAVEPAAGPAAQTELEGPQAQGAEGGGGEFEAPAITDINSIDPLGPIGNEEFGSSVPEPEATDVIIDENELPIARNDAYQTTEDGPPIVVAPNGILANDSDPDGDPLSVNDAGGITINSVTLQSAPVGFDDSNLGTLSVGANGSLNYTPSANFQALGVGESVVMTFTYTASDGEVDTNVATVTITVTGLNDDPVIEIGEGDSARGEVVEYADLDQTDGADDVNEGGTHEIDGTLSFSDPDANDSHTVSSITPAAGGYLGSFTADVTTQTVNGEGGVVTWDFEVDDSALDYLAVGETLVQTYEIEISDGNGGFDTLDVTVTIEGTNDGPVIAAGDSAEISEITDGDPDENAFLHQAGGTLDFTDEDFSDTHGVSFDPQGEGYLGTFNVVLGQDTSNGVGGELDWTFEVEDSALDFLGAGDTLVQTYTVTVDDGNGGTHTQDVVITINGTNDLPVITVGEDDDDSGSVTEVVDADTTDGLDDPSEGVVVPATELTDSGTLSFSDADHSDDGTHSVAGWTPAAGGYLGTFSASVTTDTTDGQGGVITWDFSVLDIDVNYLGAGETLTQTYSIELSDGSGGSTFQDVEITITGSNDGPVITSGPAQETITELPDGDPGENTFLHTVDGTLDFTDEDFIDTHSVDYTPQDEGYLGTFSVSINTDTVNGVGGVIDWGFEVSDADLDSLGINDSLLQTYVVTVDDGEGGTHTQTVTITLSGANNTPVAVNDTNYIVEDTPSVSGMAITGQDNGSYDGTNYADQADTDADGQDLDITAITGDNGTVDGGAIFTVTGTYGTLVINKESGDYTYSLNNADPTVQGLDDDDLVQDTFNYTVSDGTLTANAAIVIDIYGQNDTPTISDDETVRVSEEGLNNAIADDVGSSDTTDVVEVTGQFDVNDADIGETLSVTLGEPVGSYTSNDVTITWSGAGTGTLIGSAGATPIIQITIDNDGNYTVTLTGPIDHTEGDNIEGELTIVTEVTVSDGDESASSDLTIIIEDDSPEDGQSGVMVANQDTASPPDPEVNNESLNIAYGGDGIGDTFTLTGWTLPDGFSGSLNGNTLTITQDDGDAEFAFTVNSDGTYDFDVVTAIQPEPFFIDLTALPDPGGPDLTRFSVLSTDDGTGYGFVFTGDSTMENETVTIGSLFGDIFDSDAAVNIANTGAGVEGGGPNAVFEDYEGLSIQFLTEQSIQVDQNGDPVAIVNPQPRVVTGLVLLSTTQTDATDQFVIHFLLNGEVVDTAGDEPGEIVFNDLNGNSDTYTIIGFEETQYDQLLIQSTSSNTEMKILGFEILGFEELEDQTFQFQVTGEDADGDTAISDVTVTVDANNDTIAEVTGTSGSDALVGTTGDDVIIGLAGNDALSGLGGADTFVFSLTGDFGDDVITDFDPAADSLTFTDVLDQDTSGTIDLADVELSVAGVVDDGTDVVVTFNEGGSITFEGIGDGTISSISDIVNDPNTDVVVS
jgi:VCBS repeat-containing protein